MHFLANMIRRVELFVKYNVIYGPNWRIIKLGLVNKSICYVANEEVCIKEELEFILGCTAFIFEAWRPSQYRLIARIYFKVEITVLRCNNSALKVYIVAI